MLGKLTEVLEKLPELLTKRSNWDSLIVNRRKPWTYRVYCQLPNGLRVCLHRFEVCDTHESHPHPHPWPGAFFLLDGAYRMTTAYSPDRTKDDRVEIATFVLEKWSSYEITNPLTWHSITPLKTTYTVMINGEAWPEDVAHVSVRRTKGKDLEKMPENDLADHLFKFKKLIRHYLYGE